MSDYTPKTENVRLGYSYREHLPEGERHHPPLLAEFDRWLSAHDAEVRAAALADQGKPQVTDDEVCVEGSWFKRSELPTILGNFMRLADERERELKEATITMTELRSTIVTDEMIERGARAMLGAWVRRGSAPPGEALRWEFKDDVRAVLEAALGGAS